MTELFEILEKVSNLETDVLTAERQIIGIFRPETINYYMVTIEDITKVVCSTLNVNPDRIKVKTRLQDIVEARQIIFALARFGLNMGYREIGVKMGNFDHVTVLYGVNKASDYYNNYRPFRQQIINIVSRIFSDQLHRAIILNKFARTTSNVAAWQTIGTKTIQDTGQR